MPSKRPIRLVAAIVGFLILGFVFYAALHSVSGTGSGVYSGGASPATVSPILNRNRTGNVMVTPTGANKDIRWRRRGDKVFLYASNDRNIALETPFATGTVSDRGDVLNMSLPSEMVSSTGTGGTATVVLAKARRR